MSPAGWLGVQSPESSWYEKALTPTTRILVVNSELQAERWGNALSDRWVGLCRGASPHQILRGTELRVSRLLPL